MTGKEVEASEKTFAIWMFMDEDSKEKSLRKNLVEGDTSFELVCDHLEAICSEEGNRQAIAAYAKAQAPVKMDIGALAPGAGAGSVGPEPVVPEDHHASLDASGNAKCFKCEGMGHRQAECTSKPEVQLACNRCGGWGHYASDCATKVSEGKEGKGAKGDGGKGKGKGDWGKSGKGDWGKSGKGRGSKGWGKGDGGKGTKSGAIKGKGKGTGKGKKGMSEIDDAND